jgi:YD repeat-containing protein
MATRKKKTDVIMSADIAEMTGPKVVKGNHLTVTTHPDGRTELVWDDDALLAEVRTALESAELADMKPAVKAKVITQRKKKEKANGN